MRHALLHDARDVGSSAWLINPMSFWHLAVALMLTLGVGGAAEVTEVIRVEEDWELVVRDPDAGNSAPQLTCVMAPVGNTDSLHIALELNHKTLPSYDPGGIQLQVWNGKYLLGNPNSPVAGVLHNSNETVRWTTKMSLQSDGLLFEVTDGSSISWGAFGGQGYLKAAVSCSVSSLSGYSPETSRANSGIGYAANRVESLVLKEVRYYSSQGLVHRDTTSRVVYQCD